MKKENIFGKQNMGEKKGPNKTGRFILLMSIALVSLWAATQYVAHSFGYHESLGFNVSNVYPPHKALVWYFQLKESENWLQYADVFNTATLLGATICAAGFLAVLIILNVMQNSAKPTENLHGSAKWATEEDIIKATLLPHKKSKKPHSGVYVGGWIHPKTKKLLYLRHNGPEHVLCYAPTRSGKGVGLVLPTLLSWNESSIITDIKGELWELTAGWRKKYGKNKVIRFEPASLNSAKWNVFDSIRFGTEYEERDVGNVASLVVDPDGKGLEDHWAKTAYALLVGCILHVHYKSLKAPGTCERSLSGVDSLLSNPNMPIDQTWEDMKTFHHLDPLLKPNGEELAPERVHPTVAKTAQDMIDRAEAEAASVLSTVKSYLSLYRDPVIRENTSTSDFTIHQIANMDDPISLFIITKPADLTRIRPIFRLMITLVISILADELKTVNGRMERANKHRTLLMLDEFPSLGKLDIMQRGLAFIAGYGLKAYLICQDLTQLYGAYGKDESITSNCHVQIAYPPNRPETAKYISALTGATTAIKEDVNISGKRTGLFQNNVSRTQREQARNLLTEDEVLRLPSPEKDHNGNIVKPGHMLIFSAGLPAIYGQQILYFKDDAFLKRSQIPAPKDTDTLREFLPNLATNAVDLKTTKTVYKAEAAEGNESQPQEGQEEPQAALEQPEPQEEPQAATEQPEPQEEPQAATEQPEPQEEPNEETEDQEDDDWKPKKTTDENEADSLDGLEFL